MDEVVVRGNVVVPIALFGWIPLVVVLFSLLPARRAVIVAYVGAWLFLPIASYPIPFLPIGYGKMFAASVGVLLGALAFDAQTFVTYKPRIPDLIVLLYCFQPFATARANGFDFNTGAGAVLSLLVSSALPYFIGRLYFSSLPACKELAIGILLGGFVYVPFCIWEWRMSPQLHTILYGFHQHQFAQTVRSVGFRPVVFMGHGLMVSLWMTLAGLIGVWFWLTATVKRLVGLPIYAIVLLILVVVTLTQSVGALVIIILALSALLYAKVRESRVLFSVLLAIVFAYPFLRIAGWDGKEMVDVMDTVFGSSARSGSLEYRLGMEEILVDHAMRRPIFGWDRIDDRNRPQGILTVTDSVWIIVLGVRGISGLALHLLTYLLPVALFIKRFPARMWSQPAFAPAAALAVITFMYVFDSMFNAMGNPMALLAGAALVGVTPKELEAFDVARMPNELRDQAACAATEEVTRPAQRRRPSGA